jgi:hypothetical protein
VAGRAIGRYLTRHRPPLPASEEAPRSSHGGKGRQRDEERGLQLNAFALTGLISV